MQICKFTHFIRKRKNKGRLCLPYYADYSRGHLSVQDYS